VADRLDAGLLIRQWRERMGEQRHLMVHPFIEGAQPTAEVAHILRHDLVELLFQLSAIPLRKIGGHHNALRNHNGPFIKVTPVNCRCVVIQSLGCLQ